MESKSKDPFSDLEFFNDARFQPPEWAKDFPVASSSSSSRRPGASGHTDDLRPPPPTHPAFTHQASGGSDDDAPGGVDEDEEEGEEEWADAQEEIHEPPEVKDPTKEYTAEELQTLLEQATKLKDQGNASYASKPPSYEDAIVAYTRAIEYLPPMPKRPSETARGKARAESPLCAAGAPGGGGGGGLVEVTDAEAEEIERERLGEKSAKRVLEDAQDAVRECEKACWGNLGACHVALEKDDKAAVEACTKALEIDPTYIKALQRRAAANDRIGTWSSLTAAQDDYAALLTLLPPTSPLAPPIRKSLNALPGRIKVQQEKEKDEMLGKLKELGNGILGRFGLSTDMFKFEQQPGGGYNMSFQQG